MANKLSASISVHDMPEVLADLCARMAGLLRERSASQEDTVIGWAVRDALLEVASAFEVGQGTAETEAHRV